MSFSESAPEKLTAVIPICEPIEELVALSSLISLIRHTLIKLVLVVDMKNYETFEYLQDLTQDINNISVFHVNFGNPGETREYGRQHVITEFICFWDSDDHPNISAILQVIENSSADIDVYIGNYSLKFINGKKPNVLVKHQENLEFIHLNPGVWRFIFRNESILDAHFPPIRMGEDQIFLLETKLWEKNIAFVNKNFYDYSVGRAGQLTETRSALVDLLPAFKLITSLHDDFRQNLATRYYSIVATRIYVSLIKRMPFSSIIKPSIFMIFHPSVLIMGAKIFFKHSRKRR